MTQPVTSRERISTSDALKHPNGQVPTTFRAVPTFRLTHGAATLVMAAKTLIYPAHLIADLTHDTDGAAPCVTTQSGAGRCFFFDFFWCGFSADRRDIYSDENVTPLAPRSSRHFDPVCDPSNLALRHRHPKHEAQPIAGRALACEDRASCINNRSRGRKVPPRVPETGHTVADRPT